MVVSLYIIKTGDGKTLHNPLLKTSAKIVDAPQMEEEVNAIGSLTFTMLPNHPYYDSIKKLSTLIFAYDDDGEIFRGRVYNTTNDFNKQKKVVCQSEMGFFGDSIVRPFGYSGTVRDFIQKLIDNHNAQVDEYKQFVLGNVTVTDTNDYITRSNTSAQTTWATMKDRCIDLLGGYFQIRHEGGIRYLDYLADYSVKNSQTIKFGTNLLDLEEYVDASNVKTVVIPYGTQLDSSSPYYQAEPPENAEYSGNRITINTLTSDNRDYIESEIGVALYGRIWCNQIWDDVTERSNLLTKATAWLEEQILLSTTLTISALDLHLVDVNIEKLQLAQLNELKSIPHDISIWLPVTKISRSLSNPDDLKVTLGKTKSTLTGKL